jgi:hypothetical protein
MDLFEGAERTQALFIVQQNPDLFMDGFEAYLNEQWAVWKAFEHEAQRVAFRGRQHYSAKTIVEWLRHETVVKEANSLFKVNNNATSSLARLFVLRHPRFADFFEFREMPGGLRKPEVVDEADARF